MNDRVGIGIVGTGFARKVQIPSFLACKNAFIASVASGSLANAKATAEESGAGHFTDDWRETVTNPDVDLVCISTPPVLHREMVLFAVEHRRQILCEKPMAMNVREAEEMTAAASDAGILALIDHELRFLPGRQKAYEMLRSGEIGKVHHAKYLFAAAFRSDPEHPWNWWSDIKQGGGALGAINSHVIDSLNWFLGTEISSVFCQLQTKIRQRRDSSGELRDVTADDEANMMVQFRDSELTENASGLISVSMAEGPGHKNLIEFYGTAGSMRVDNFGELSIGKQGEADWTQIEADLPRAAEGAPDTGFSRGFMLLAPNIVEAIRSGERSIPHAATFEDGLRVQRVLDAARESDASGCVVRIS